MKMRRVLERKKKWKRRRRLVSFKGKKKLRRDYERKEARSWQSNKKKEEN